eukprot:6109174-Alexandrium_andersonii.AAC.1
MMCSSAFRCMPRGLATAASCMTSFWDSVKSICNSRPSDAVLIVGGDFNSRVSLSEPWIGPSSGEVTDQCGARMVEFLREFGLCALNTWLHEDTSRYTYDADGRRSQIDFLCVPLSRARRFRDT